MVAAEGCAATAGGQEREAGRPWPAAATAEPSVRLAQP